MKNNIINTSLEKYNKKYRNRREHLVKISKKEVESFDKKYPNSGKNYLLSKGKWALIGDTYYEIPKAPRFTWFRNLNAGIQVGTCILGAGVIGAAVAVPIVLHEQYVYKVKAEKILKAANYTIQKVNTFNLTMSQCDFSKEMQTQNNNQIAYLESTKQDYSSEQNFGFYIYNNIHYAMKYFYGTQSIKAGTVITGTTRKMPDVLLQQLYDDKDKNLPDSILTTKVDIKSEANKSIIDFKADWDLRSDKMADIQPYSNCVIMTNGRVTFDEKNNKAEKLSINYYFTNLHRSFGSFTFDFLNDKFYYFDGGGVEDPSNPKEQWDKQTNPNETIHTRWNNGTLTADDVADTTKYNYFVFEALTGNITDKFDDIKIEGYNRRNPKSALNSNNEVTEEQWKNKINEVYAVNKELPLRNVDDLLNVSKAKKVDIVNCNKYAEGKTKLYWLFKNDQADALKLQKTYVPFFEKEELFKHIDELISLGITNNQKALLNSAKESLNNIADNNYFGEFSDNKVKYFYNSVKDSSKEIYNYNCYRVTDFNYRFEKADDSTVAVDFLIDETTGKAILK